MRRTVNRRHGQEAGIAVSENLTADRLAHQVEPGRAYLCAFSDLQGSVAIGEYSLRRLVIPLVAAGYHEWHGAKSTAAGRRGELPFQLFKILVHGRLGL